MSIAMCYAQLYEFYDVISLSLDLFPQTYQQHLTTAEHTTSSQQLQQHPSPSTSKEAINLGSPRKATSHHATSTATSSDVKNDEASAAIATDDGLVVLDACKICQRNKMRNSP